MRELRTDWPRTLDEFRTWHERQPEVYEFIDGVPRLMAPGSKAHTTIKGSVYVALRGAQGGQGAKPMSMAPKSRATTSRSSPTSW